MALGAARRDVSRLVLGEGAFLAASGVALGVLGALGLTRLMSSLLFGVSPDDPLTYVLVSLALGAIALVASFVPANRASKLHPTEALRSE
jgi:ABC-type antimicrobial peptide transport system permease subunit